MPALVLETFTLSLIVCQMFSKRTAGMNWNFPKTKRFSAKKEVYQFCRQLWLERVPVDAQGWAPVCWVNGDCVL